jgi:hypothetical protein
MKQWIVPAAAAALLTGCVSTATKTIDAQALGGMRHQNVVQTVHAKPSFGLLKPSNAAFGMLGAMDGIAEGSRIVADNKLADPADAISAGLASALRARDGVQILPQALRIDDDDPARIAARAKGKARYVLDVRTLVWQLMYFPTDWTHYQLLYTAKARLIDVDAGTVVAEAFCKQQPESNANAPTYDAMLAKRAALLKAKLAGAAEACTASLGRDMLALQGPASAPPAAPVASLAGAGRN